MCNLKKLTAHSSKLIGKPFSYELSAISSLKYDDLIGKAFEENGRGPETYDCYGVAIEINRRAGKTIPDYALLVDHALAVIQEKISEHKHEFVKVSEPEPGDIVLIRSEPGAGDHFGVIVERGAFLHTSSKAGHVHKVRLDHPFYKDRIEGIYRFKQNTQDCHFDQADFAKPTSP